MNRTSSFTMQLKPKPSDDKHLKINKNGREKKKGKSHTLEMGEGTHGVTRPPSVCSQAGQMRWPVAPSTRPSRVEPKPTPSRSALVLGVYGRRRWDRARRIMETYPIDTLRPLMLRSLCCTLMFSVMDNLVLAYCLLVWNH